MYIRFFTAIILVCVLSSCSSNRFNQTYISAQWKKIIIAPFTGDYAKTAQKRFVHEFSTNSTIQFVIPEMVAKQIKEQGLLPQYEEAPVSVLIDIATQMGADGFVHGEIMTGFDEYRRIAELNVKLIDAKTGAIVGSSLKETSSMFVGEQQIVEAGMSDVTDEFRLFFTQMNASFDN